MKEIQNLKGEKIVFILDDSASRFNEEKQEYEWHNENEGKIIFDIEPCFSFAHFVCTVDSYFKTKNVQLEDLKNIHFSLDYSLLNMICIKEKQEKALSLNFETLNLEEQKEWISVLSEKNWDGIPFYQILKFQNLEEFKKYAHLVLPYREKNEIITELSGFSCLQWLLDYVKETFKDQILNEHTLFILNEFKKNIRMHSSNYDFQLKMRKYLEEYQF